jgi:hypothetical protein
MCGDPTSDLDLVSVGGASPAVFISAEKFAGELEKISRKGAKAQRTSNPADF